MYDEPVHVWNGTAWRALSMGVSGTYPEITSTAFAPENPFVGQFWRPERLSDERVTIEIWLRRAGEGKGDAVLMNLHSTIAALRAVLELHSLGFITDKCTECGSGNPCVTIRTILETLGVDR